MWATRRIYGINGIFFVVVLVAKNSELAVKTAYSSLANGNTSILITVLKLPEIFLISLIPKPRFNSALKK